MAGCGLGGRRSRRQRRQGQDVIAGGPCPSAVIVAVAVRQQSGASAVAHALAVADDSAGRATGGRYGIGPCEDRSDTNGWQPPLSIVTAATPIGTSEPWPMSSARSSFPASALPRRPERTMAPYRRSSSAWQALLRLPSPLQSVEASQRRAAPRCGPVSPRTPRTPASLLPRPGATTGSMSRRQETFRIGREWPVCQGKETSR